MDQTTPNPPAQATTPPAAGRCGRSGPPVAFQAALAADPDHHALAGADRVLRLALARFTLGISPATIAGARTDWLAHLAMSPGKLTGLVEQAAPGAARFALHAAQSAFGQGVSAPEAPASGDHRFADEGWRRWSYNLLAQSFLLAEQWEARPPVKDGSWWPDWQAWLAARSASGAAPPTMGAPDERLPPLADAPGTYVSQR